MPHTLPSPFILQSLCFSFKSIGLFSGLEMILKYLFLDSSTYNYICLASVESSLVKGWGRRFRMFWLASVHTNQDSSSFNDTMLSSRAAVDPRLTDSRICTLTDRKPTEKGKEKKMCSQGSWSRVCHCLEFILVWLLWVYGHKVHEDFKALTKGTSPLL